MSENLQFHPEIEKALETSGEDIGRIKDVDLAHDVAHDTNDELNLYVKMEGSEYTEEPETLMPHHLERQDRLIRHEIAERAVNNKFSETVTGSLVNYALGTSQSGGRSSRFDDSKQEINVKPLLNEAKIVSEEYDTLKRMAHRARQIGVK